MNSIKNDIKVLIVEDNPGDQFLLKEQLNYIIPSKNNIQIAESLSGALAIVNTFIPDIVLLDLTLPDSLGIHTFETINRSIPSVPIVVLSGMEDTRLALQAITRGAQDYLQKGDFDEKLLSRSIQYSIERKKTLEELKSSIERYTLVSKATNDMVWDWDIQNNTVYRNEEQFCRMLRLPASMKDLTGEFWFGRIHPDDLPVSQKLLEKIQHSPSIDVFESEHRFLNGEDKYVYLFDRGYIIRNDKGLPIRIIGSTQDITKQKEINGELNKLSMIARETKNGVIITDKNENIEWVNHAFEQISGYTLDTIKGKRPGDFLQGIETDPAQIAYMRSQIQKQKGFEIELVNYNREGKKYWTNLQVQPIFDEQGHLQQFFSIQSDITAQKKADEALKRSEEQYRYLFDNNPAPIFIWNIDDFSFAEVNETFIEVYGYSRFELASMNIKQIRREEEIPALIEFAKKARAAEHLHVTRLWKHRNKNGDMMYMQVSSQKIIYRNRPAILAIAINLTEKKLLELRLEEERRQKEKEITNAVITAQENGKEYIGKELHDNVNQILASARLYVGLSKKNNPGNNIQLADELLSKAIEEIRLLSHSLIPPSFDISNLSDGIEQIVSIVEAGTEIKFEKQYSGTNYSHIPPVVQLTMYRTVQEQINNILKYASAKKVLIKTERNEEELILTIMDDGIGFDTTKKSMGVGLLNIQTRASISNGKMILKSKPGEGCLLQLVFQL
ncbi:MAG: PAS domain S-box protein [Chitinophagaceae bacterium]|nr:PAS domain S-box protein [Chitinophagaceae bacterium]